MSNSGAINSQVLKTFQGGYIQSGDQSAMNMQDCKTSKACCVNFGKFRIAGAQNGKILQR